MSRVQGLFSTTHSTFLHVPCRTEADIASPVMGETTVTICKITVSRLATQGPPAVIWQPFFPEQSNKRAQKRLQHAGDGLISAPLDQDHITLFT